MTNFLLRDDFKAIRKGSKVQADESAGEFIYQTGDTSFVLTQLEEIAKANKLDIKARKKADFQIKLDEALEKMENVAEQETTTQTENVKQIVKDGIEAGHDDDTILVAIITSGVSFRRAGKMFKDALTELGLRIATKDLKERVQDLLEEIKFSPASYDDVEAAVSEVLENVEGAQEKQTLSVIRSYAKANEIELPKKPKGQRGAIGIRGKIFEFILENPEAGEKEMAEFFESLGKDSEKMVKRHLPILQLCHQYLAKHSEAS